MAIVAGAHRNYLSRNDAYRQIRKIVDFLKIAPRFHGAFAHWYNGNTATVQPFSQKDDGADLVETSFLFQGLLCAREYFAEGANADESTLIADIDRLSDNELTPEKIRARYDAGERTPRLIKAYAAMLNDEIYNSRKGREEKQQTLDSIINDYFNSLSEKEKLSKENFFIYTDYCSRTADEKMQFLFNNRDKAKKADRAEADTLLQKAYGNELQTMVTFYYPFDKAQYDLFRRQLMTFDFANTPENQGMVAVLDAYATGDLGKYIDAVEENAGEKCGEKSFSIYYGMATALKDAPEQTKQRAAKLIRSRLAGMTATDIAFIGRVLMDLETENKH